MIHQLASRPWLNKALSGLSVLLAVVGVGMLAYPFTTNLYQGRLQNRLDGELASEGLREKYEAGRLGEGDALTRLQIPATGVDVVVVEGTTPSALRAGAGHYPATPLPGEEGNVAIAGHRTTYGRPFHNNDKIRPGDEITLDTPTGRHVYRVTPPPEGARQFDVAEGAAGYVVDSKDWGPIAMWWGARCLRSRPATPRAPPSTDSSSRPNSSSRRHHRHRTDLPGHDADQDRLRLVFSRSRSCARSAGPIAWRKWLSAAFWSPASSRSRLIRLAVYSSRVSRGR